MNLRDVKDIKTYRHRQMRLIKKAEIRWRFNLWEVHIFMPDGDLFTSKPDQDVIIGTSRKLEDAERIAFDKLDRLTGGNL